MAKASPATSPLTTLKVLRMNPSVTSINPLDTQTSPATEIIIIHLRDIKNDECLHCCRTIWGHKRRTMKALGGHSPNLVQIGPR